MHGGVKSGPARHFGWAVLVVHQARQQARASCYGFGRWQYAACFFLHKVLCNALPKVASGQCRALRGRTVRFCHGLGDGLVCQLAGLVLVMHAQPPIQHQPQHVVAPLGGDGFGLCAQIAHLRQSQQHLHQGA